MNFPKITIGIPVFNGEEFIAKTLYKLINQSYSNIEIIISNNKSTDKTLEIIQKYQKVDLRIKVINQSKHMKSVDNFRYLIDKSTGEYFMWLSHDDYFDNNYIENCLPYLQKDCAVFGNVQYINEFGKNINKIQNKRTFRFNNKSLINKFKYVFYPSLSGKMILFWSIFPLHALKKHKKDLKNNFGDIDYFDLPFIYCCLDSINFISVQNIFFYKRNHSKSNSNLHSKKNEKLYLYKLFDHLFTIKSFKTFCANSSSFEVLLYILIYPIGLIFNFFGNIFLILNYYYKKNE